MAEWVKSSHCSWDRGDQRIVQEYCPTQGGIVFKLFNGAWVTRHRTLAEAMGQANLPGVCDE